MKRQDIFLGLYILVPVVFLIVPIPTLLLDILILFNIGIALIILFNALFSKEALNIYKKHSVKRICGKCSRDIRSVRWWWKPRCWYGYILYIDYYSVYSNQ